LRRVELHLVLARHSNRLLLAVVVERQRRAQKRINDAAHAPQVALVRVRLLVQDFWGHVAQRSEGFLRLLIRPDHLRKAKVNELWNRLVRSISHHNIFELQITMHDAVAVQVAQSKRQLPRNVLDSVFAELEVSRLQVVK
jgi:hypothetical protein